MISAPEEYGFTPAETLAFRVEDDPPPGVDAFWKETRDAVSHLPSLFRGAIEPGVNEVRFESLRSVRIVGRLTMPEGEVAGAVVTTHGYEADSTWPSDAEPWTGRGLATLRIRVRGYPPSVEDTGDLRQGWILRGIEQPEAWILRGAVVDLVQACRCLRRYLGPRVPIGLHGESFGGGLAVIAAAQLEALGDAPFRMVLGLPSLGAWAWRTGRYCNGLGGEVNRLLETMRDEAETILEHVRLFDAAYHARQVHSPTLCKLACRDDVSPAPAAAAVFNGLASTRSWRYVTQFGHFDGGLADLRRHARFERLHPVFLDPRTDLDAFDAEFRAKTPEPSGTG